MRNFDGHATLLFGILIGLALGLIVGMWSPPSTFEVPEACQGQEFWCWLNDWQTLVSAIVAVAATLMAATIAWFAVQAQIAVTHLPADQTKLVLDNFLEEFLQEVNQAWRFLEVALDHNYSEERKFTALNIACAEVDSSFQSSNILDCSEMLTDLLPAQKHAYEQVFISLRRIKTELERKRSDDDPEKGYGLSAQLFAIQLSHLVKYLEQANHTLAEVFSEREKYDVDHTLSWHSSKKRADIQLEKWADELSKQQA
ncbi:hypothetical protein ABVF61_00540 [Roseibium sp. HPY-6]|uniref:hypothetical protein n=1 Tax=Roseibium sp. HPY-6 TaxID=3229852 RepID=UPI00338D8B91